MFWTNFIPSSSVKVRHGEFEDGATLDVERLALFDYGSLGNALNDGPSVDATVSYRLRWAGHGSTPLTINDPLFLFEGRKTNAFISWSAHESGFRFHSSPAHTTTTNFAVLGKERNGVFRSGG